MRVVLNVDVGGHGDLLTHLWHAEGYRSRGIDCVFYATGGGKQELVRMFGHEVSTLQQDRAVGITTGGRASHYHYELHEDRGKNARAYIWAAKLPHNPPCIRPPHALPADEMASIKESIESLCGTLPFVALFPEAEFSPRKWPNVYWVDLHRTLRDRGFSSAVFVPNGREPFYREKRCNTYWGQSWTKLACAMKHSALVIGNDSAPAHLAGTLGVRALAIVGPTQRVFAHCADVVREVHADKARVPCTGCHFRGEKGFRDVCDVMCRSLHNLLPEEVYTQALSWGALQPPSESPKPTAPPTEDAPVVEL